MGPAGRRRKQAGRRRHRRHSGLPRRQRRSCADVRAFRQLHRASVHVHQVVLQPGRPDPDCRVSTTILAVAVNKDAPYNNVKEFTEAVRAAPGKFNSGLVQGITEFTFWGYEHHEKLQIAQVPYRDINVAPVDLGEGRIQVVMSSLAVVQPQWRAGRIKLITVTNKNRVKAAPDVPTAREQGYPSLEVEGMAGLFGIKSMSEQLKEKIAADVREAAADGSIGERLEATGQIINVGGPKEFANSIAEQSANVAAVARAIDFKPKN